MECKLLLKAPLTTGGETMGIITKQVQVPLILLALALGLAACGGGGDEAPSYALRINSAVGNLNYPEGQALLTGEGFLPPGSFCGNDPFPGQFDVIRSDHLGSYELTWTNATTGETGRAGLSWSCGTAPTWWTFVPLAPGENHIVISMRTVPMRPESGGSGRPSAAGPVVEQNVEVEVTRR